MTRRLENPNPAHRHRGGISASIRLFNQQPLPVAPPAHFHLPMCSAPATERAKRTPKTRTGQEKSAGSPILTRLTPQTTGRSVGWLTQFDDRVMDGVDRQVG